MVLLGLLGRLPQQTAAILAASLPKTTTAPSCNWIKSVCSKAESLSTHLQCVVACTARDREYLSEQHSEFLGHSIASTGFAHAWQAVPLWDLDIGAPS